MTTAQVVTVLEGRYAEAEKRLEALARKAQRYGNEPITWERGTPYIQLQKRVDWDGREREYQSILVDVTISGGAPKVEGWRFLASVEPTPAGALVYTAPGAEVDPRFREADGHCDHCGTNRRRAKVYVVEEAATGQQLQVGRSCLRDFLGIDNPAIVAGAFSCWAQARDLGGIGWDWSHTTEGLLTLGLAVVRAFGWCSRGQANADPSLTPTADHVSTVLRPATNKYDQEIKQQIFAARLDSDSETAAEIRRWAIEDAKADSDYMHNLRVILGVDLQTDPGRVPLLVSAIAAWHRAREAELRRAKERQAAPTGGGHVGKVGERLRGLKVRRTLARNIGDKGYGQVILYKFADEAGNVYSWFTGSNLAEGEELAVDATVKRHTEHTGVKETQLTRVTVKGTR